MRDNTAGTKPAPKNRVEAARKREDEVAAYNAELAKGMTQTSRPVTGTNTGKRPLGLGKAIDDAVSEMGRDKRTSARYVRMSPTFTEEKADSIWETALAALTDDDSARAQSRRDANAAMGLPVLGAGLGPVGAQSAQSVAEGVGFATQLVYKPALAALQGFDWAWENIVAEPLATVALATNENNPVFEDGFQPGDAIGMWTAAREAANDTSWGVALNTNQFWLAAATSPMAKSMPGIGQIFGLTALVEPILRGVDPFDPTSVQEARDNYVAFNAITGATDFGLNFLPIPAGKGVGALRRVTGLSSKVREADRAVIRHDWELFKRWAASNGEDGYETNIGRQIMEIADSSDVGFILERPLVKNQSGAAKGQLADLYVKTQDPEAVFDIFQASIGDTQAIQRLLDTGNADLAYSLGNVGDGILAVVSGGGRYRPTGQSKYYFDAAKRDAIQREEWSRSLYRTFLTEGKDESGVSSLVFTPLGDWAPMGGNARILPSIAKPVAKAVERSRIAAADMRAALKTGNEEYLPAVAEKFIQTTKNGPMIRLISIRPGALQWSMANRPLNIISFSGSRPDDVVEEAYAVMNQVEGLRFGEQIPVDVTYTAGGEPVLRYMSAADFREKHIAAITRAMSMNGDAVAQAFRALENDIVSSMAMKQGLSKADADKIVEGFRNAADENYTSIRETGTFIDDRNGMTVEMDPKTLRQLRESYYTMPINQIEAAFKSEAHKVLRRPAQYVGDGAREAFEFGSTLFRTNMLLKPGYTFRNSILEPWVTTVIAHGMMLATPQGLAMMGRGGANFVKNTGRRTARVTAGTVDMIKSGRLTGKQKKLVNEYNTYKSIRDDLVDEIERKNIMPSPRAQAELEEIRDELTHVDSMLGLVVRDLVDQGVADSALHLREPSLHRLDTEINDMIKVADDPLDGRLVESAEQKALDAAGRNDDAMFEYWSARAEVLKQIESMPQGERDEILISLRNLKKQTRSIGKRKPTADTRDHILRVEELTAKMEAVQDKLLVARQQHALVKARRERRAKPILQGEGTRTKTLANGQTVTVDEAFAGTFGSAYRADSSSAVTNVQAFNTAAHHTTMLNMVMSRFRRGRTGSINVNDPHYFEELHYIAARHFAGDELFDLIATKSKADVMSWAKSDRGKRYFDALGVSGKTYMKDLDEAYYVYNKLFPTKEAQELLSSGREFSTGELQAALLKPGPDGEIPRLGDIVGQEIDYVVPASIFHQAGAMYKRALDKIWDYIATQPETRLARWPYYVRQFDQELTNRMNILARQGIDIDVAIANAQRKASHVATLSNLEKTFYNIRRYNNVAFTSRFVMAFPGAFFNSIRRYGYYLPTRHPAEMMTLMNLTNSAFESMAVDEYGQRSDLQNAKYLLIPGTGQPVKDKYGIVQDAGVRIPIDAATRIFLDNPGRSWLTALSVDSILNMKPEWDQVMKEYLPDYATAFLQNAEPPSTPGGEWQGGPQPGSPLDIMVGSLAANWQKTAVNWWQGTGSEKYKLDWGWAWQNVQAEKLRRGDTSPVTVEEVNEVVDGWTALRFIVQFASPTSYRIDAPGQLERDMWFRIRDDFPDLSFEEQREKYYEILGADADDPLTAAKRKDWGMPYTMSTSRDPYGMNANYSVEARNAIKNHMGLAEKLGGVDPELVGLLAVGVGGSFSRAVYNNMSFDKPYDSAIEPFRSKKMPNEYITDWAVTEGWNEWSVSKTQYVETRKNAVAQNNRAWVKAIDDSWDEYVADITARRPEWAIRKSKIAVDEVNAVALAIGEMRKDSSFMSDRGNDEDWQTVWELLDRRDEVKNRIKSLGSTDREDQYKKDLKEYYISYYNEESLKNPLLMDLWDRYFASEFEER